MVWAGWGVPAMLSKYLIKVKLRKGGDKMETKAMSKKVFKKQAFLLFSLALIWSFSFSQSRETGAVEGTVVMEDQTPLPGVDVALSSPSMIGGTRHFITDQEGRFRFVALAPGTYAVEARLEGFAPAGVADIRIHVGLTLKVNLILKPGTISEEIRVVAQAPAVDFKDSQMASAKMSKELLANIPVSQTGDLYNVQALAPSAYQESVFGGNQATGDAFLVDGIDTSAADYGDTWVRLEFTTIEEGSVMGIGANAEYDGYNGAVINIVTKSGGNKISGEAQVFYQGMTWNSTNTGNPEDAPKQSVLLTNISLGGPIIKDRFWWFGNASLTSSEAKQFGFPLNRTASLPKGFLKATYQPGKRDRLQLFMNYDQMLYENSGDAFTAPEAPRNAKKWCFTGNFNWLHTFSSETMLEFKFNGYDSVWNDYGSQGDNVMGAYDPATGGLSGNFPWKVRNDISRLASEMVLSHHAEGFLGNHDFKAGVQYDRSYTKMTAAYNGGGMYVNYMGSPYLLYRGGSYVVEGTAHRVSAFVQDAWTVSDRLTINPGLRLNIFRGVSPILNETVYKSEGIAPRIGLTYDLLGDRSTAVKLHYGRYFWKFTASLFGRMGQSFEDKDVFLFNYDTGDYQFLYTVQGGSLFGVDKSIKHPYVDQFSVGIERELLKDVTFTATYINKSNKNIIEAVNVTGQFEPVRFTDPETGAALTAYNQLNPGEDFFLITNPSTGVKNVLVNPTLNYQSLEFVLAKRYSNNWQATVSYTYSKTKGTYLNSYEAAFGSGGMYENPNKQININGVPPLDPRHIFKIMSSVVVPYVDVSLAAHFLYASGTTWTRSVYTPALNQGRTTIYTEPKGSRRLKSQANLDFRLEKPFRIKNMRLGLLVDVFNVLNSDFPLYVSGTAGPDFGQPIDITSPRGWRVGLRFAF